MTDILEIAYNQWISDQNKLRTEEQEKAFAYYQGEKSKVETYLYNALNLSYDSDDLLEFQKNYINITKKIVNGLAVVYKDPATRTLNKKDGTPDLKMSQYYNNIIDSVNTADKTAHRYAKLVNTSLTGVFFNDGKIRYKTLPSWYYDVLTDESNPDKITAVSYDCYFTTTNGKQELFTVVWTDTENYMMQHLEVGKTITPGDKRQVPGATSMTNPYGVVPYVRLSLEPSSDFWGIGISDIVNLNEQINVMLTNLINEQILMGGAGTVLAVNCGLKTKTEDGEVVPKKVRVGRRHPMVVEDVRKDDMPPKLEYIATTPFVTELLNAVDWHIKMAALSKGLNPNSFLQDVKATSGFSKVIDAIEQLETRKDDIEPCRVYEEQRFNITRTVNNYHAGTTDKSKYTLQVIPEDASLMVDFAEIQMPKTQQEQENEDIFNLDNNIISVIDIAKRKNPDLSDDEIKMQLEANKLLNDTYRPKTTTVIPEADPANATLGKGANGDNHFMQGDEHSCGECVVSSVMSMYGMDLKQTMNTDNGTSAETIIQTLKENGINAEQRTGLTYQQIYVDKMNKSIAYYPQQQHWVSIEKIEPNKILVNDSLKDKPEWVTMKQFTSDWDMSLITTKK